MRPFALLILALLAASPVLAAGRWVKQCSQQGCRMVWVEDAPKAAACQCPYCNCDQAGLPVNAAHCAKHNCAHMRPVAATSQRQHSRAAPAACSSCGQGWYLGKNLGRRR